jgi:DNA-binding NarL/FixJ family response regulator
MVIRILIVDNSAVFRESLRELLAAHADWEVCGEAVDGLEGIQMNRLLKPDLIIMDLSMPHMSGIEATTEILKDFPKVPILLLTLYLTPEITLEARKAGIRATLSKAAANHLVGSIDAVLRAKEFEPKNRHRMGARPDIVR